jgi:hypothetical protein
VDKLLKPMSQIELFGLVRFVAALRVMKGGMETPGLTSVSQRSLSTPSSKRISVISIMQSCGRAARGFQVQDDVGERKQGYGRSENGADSG